MIEPPPPTTREFRCIHCNGTIAIPYDLPPTTAPCPHCNNPITSPAVGVDPVSQIPAPAPTVAIQATTPTPAPTPAPESDTTPPVAAAPPPSPVARPTPASRGFRTAVVPGLLVLLLLGLCAGIAFAVLHLSKRRSDSTPVGQHPEKNTSPRQPQWQDEAYQVLDAFQKGTTVAERMPYVINRPGLQQQMESFYGGGGIDDSETPANAYSSRNAPAEDMQRGIFLLTYKRPAQFTMGQFFRPLAPVAVQWGLQDADSLLAAVANMSNFTEEPVNVMAFLLRTPEGLKLDWETFVQTKHNTLESFLDVPEPDHAAVFRVVIWEDIAEAGKDKQGSRTYRVVSPTHPTNGVRVTVATDSELGKTLSVINWRRVPGTPKQTTRTATLELKWTVDPEPRVIISRFLCWEFLGVGGKEGNHLIQPAPKSAPDKADKP